MELVFNRISTNTALSLVSSLRLSTHKTCRFWDPTLISGIWSNFRVSISGHRGVNFEFELICEKLIQWDKKKLFGEDKENKKKSRETIPVTKCYNFYVIIFNVIILMLSILIFLNFSMISLSRYQICVIITCYNGGPHLTKKLNLVKYFLLCISKHVLLSCTIYA